MIIVNAINGNEGIFITNSGTSAVAMRIKNTDVVLQAGEWLVYALGPNPLNITSLPPEVYGAKPAKPFNVGNEIAGAFQNVRNGTSPQKSNAGIITNKAIANSFAKREAK